MAKLQQYVQLVCIDVIQKLKEYLKDKQVYPMSLTLTQRFIVWSHNRDEMNSNCFKKTVKMVQYDDFTADPACLIALAKKVFEENKDQLVFPCKMVSMTCQNFKPIHKLKLPTRKIDNIFTKVDVGD